ncbi:MAG: hypothetical protein KGZ50_11635 [Peptococcaceae bacterium]|nr:hypothetical protein [Peptococcaceae bacterium]
MKKHYTLQQVLELKKQLERQQMLVLARAEQTRQEQAEHIQALVLGFEEQVEVCVAPEFIDCRSMYLECQHLELQFAQGQLSEMVADCDVARQDLIYAALERRKLELHRDSCEAAWSYIWQRKEQSHSDEVAALMYNRPRALTR